MLRKIFLILPLLVAFNAPSAVMADDALYGAPVPSDAVFVRQFGNGDPIRLFGRTFNNAELPSEAFAAISASALDGAVPGTYYSAFGQNGGARLIAEPDREKNGKVHLVLVNASDAPVRLLIQENGAEVIAWTDPGQAASRAVNPVTVDLSVEAADGATTVPVKLRRGQNVSILVTADETRIVPDAFGTVID